jgi:hypothetical protein
VSKQQFSIGGNYLIAVDGKVLTDTFSIEMENPLGFLLDKLKAAALDVVKSSYKELAAIF